MHPASGTAHAAHTHDDTLAGRLASSLLAALLGLGLLYAAGFAEMDILHNAAHDTRHSAAFPCH
ncbi:CbtB domain-containing protein [Thiohalobacter sp. IOR34]|uniref:CbtB domain-containing protein n=1 Tax=Thiohalobacter sp. IOR34 TaxID=3057176 RepID=UPI0025AF9507|nr:CbtB domain-containing protein [Thiohalobacter sp. IOR34]WJW75709.1 CbtB domain-containing protein [Thiohalobacter sp. IOR34]